MTDEEIKNTLSTVFRATFPNNTVEISETTTASDIKGWDSLAHINLILAVENAFGIRFATRDVRSMKTVGDMMCLIKTKTTRG
jgi:acyl carrier protein